jgi:AdoMet-dependent heme synthase
LASIGRMPCSFAGDSHCALSRGGQAEAINFDEPSESGSRLSGIRDIDQRPTVVVWETTQACDLKCISCRANARPHRHPLELSTAEAYHLIDQVAKMKVPLLVLTGGDPLKRADILPIVQYACKRGVNTVVTPSTTPLLVRQAIVDLKESGLLRLAIGLDGSTPELHDGFRGSLGSYRKSLEAISWCRDVDLPVQVNTTVSRRNFGDLDNMINLLIAQRVALWRVFFLVPTGRMQMQDLLTADEHEQVFAKLHEASLRVKFAIKTVEGPHYRRFVLQQKANVAGAKPDQAAVESRSNGFNDGKGVAFISHTGEIYPSAFLPLSGGNILWEPLSEIYQNSPLFRSLRDSSQLKGKCGHCEFNEVCGGSRARAFALSHDPLAEEPRCAYVPV